MKDIIAGTYVLPAWASSKTRDFITACHISNQAKSLAKTPDIITRFQQQRKLWEITKEKTCTYNQHIGHLKAIFIDKFLSWLFFQQV